MRPQDLPMAIKIYEKAQCKEKLVQCYMQTGQMEKAMQLQSSFGGRADYQAMFRSMIPSDPQGAMQMAIKICQQDSSVNVHHIAELFL